MLDQKEHNQTVINAYRTFFERDAKKVILFQISNPENLVAIIQKWDLWLLVHYSFRDGAWKVQSEHRRFLEELVPLMPALLQKIVQENTNE